MTDELTAERKHRRSCILCVEDEATNALIIEQALMDQYKVLHATKASEAVSTLRSLKEPLDAILMDVHLRDSELNGYDLTRLLKGRDHPSRFGPKFRDVAVVAAPIIFVTAVEESFPEAMLLRAGGVEVLKKPINATVLRLSVASHRVRHLHGRPKR